MKKSIPIKRFKVAMISDNRNSFGLFGFVIIAKDGAAWQIAGNDLRVGEFPKGSIIKVQGNTDSDFETSFTIMGFEIPTRMLPDCPPKAVKQVWAA